MSSTETTTPQHRKPLQMLAQCISHILHPLFTLTYSALVICAYTPVLMLPSEAKFFFVGVVAFFTFLLPVVIILLLNVCHVIGHWNLRDVRDRTIPFLTNFICYLTNYLVLQRINFLPDWVLMPYLGSVVLTFVAWIVSFWWKISAHASANAAAATFFLLLYYYIPSMMPLWLVFVPVALVGLVSSTRLYLGRHTLAQVGAGTLLGIVSMGIANHIYF